MQRLGRNDYYMNVALLTSLRSTCERTSVGCVIVSDGRIISTGHNGSLPGHAECNEANCNLDNPCKIAVHAEANAIAWASKQGIALKDSIVYCSHLPCEKCAELIVQAGIRQVYYFHMYRDQTGKKVLESSGVIVSHYEPMFKIESDGL